MARVPMICDPNHGFGPRLLLLATLCVALGCNGELRGEVEGQKFVRCAQVRPPDERVYRASEWSFTVRERTLRLEGALPLSIAAFTGPVGQSWTAGDLAQLSSDKPALVLILGGLGDDDAQAGQNLGRLAALRIPSVFIAGGADRRSVVEAAFSALPEAQRDWMFDGSGLRELRVEARGPSAREPKTADQRFVIAAGAALGRYALDEQACGLAPEDFSAIQAGLQPAARTYLLSWHAAAGFGVREGRDLGSPELMALGRAVGAVGGLFAFPEPAAIPSVARALGPREQDSTARAWVVPRLGAPGTQRGDGARLHSRAGRWLLGPNGLVLLAPP